MRSSSPVQQQVCNLHIIIAVIIIATIFIVAAAPGNNLITYCQLTYT